MVAEIGGLIVCRPNPIPYKHGDVIGFRLMSDLHIGAPNVDYDLVEKELKDARDKGDRILLNGDLVDMILPKDIKRFDPSHVHPRLLGRGDVVNAQIDWACEILLPYADLIDMVGLGNHETAVTKHHNIDPTSIIVYRLQNASSPEHIIHYGGYGGFVDYRLREKGRKDGSGQRFIIYFTHGSGGGAPVTKGMIDLHRTGWVNDADVIWKGHRHVRVSTHIQAISCPITGHEPRVREIRQIITGSYFDTYRGQTQKSIRETGRRANWAADNAFAPQGKGGARITLQMRRSGNDRGFDMLVEQ